MFRRTGALGLLIGPVRTLNGCLCDVYLYESLRSSQSILQQICFFFTLCCIQFVKRHLFLYKCCDYPQYCREGFNELGHTRSSIWRVWRPVIFSFLVLYCSHSRHVPVLFRKVGHYNFFVLFTIIHKLSCHSSLYSLFSYSTISRNWESVMYLCILDCPL